MIITSEQMNQMHDIQLEIFKEIIRVCNELNLTYYMVHGSLLGTIKDNKFIPLDDDIDISMFRKDYETLLKEGNKIINKRYFIQSNKTDKEYPLEFAKVRDSQTTYVAELLQNANINHGVFIDIFPIDYVDNKNNGSRFTRIRRKLLDYRISSVFAGEKSFSSKCKLFVSRLIYPSWKNAVLKREKINSNEQSSKLINITGGKPKERGIPAEWFRESKKGLFEGVECLIPEGYHEYLTQIYGDYATRTLLENKEHSDDSVEINAIIFDLEKPFLEYMKRD